MPYTAAKDQFSSDKRHVPDQANAAVAVTPNDSTDLTNYAKALYIGVTGDVTIIPKKNADGAPILFKAHPVGYLPVETRRVMATGTAATNIVALIDV